MVSGDVMSAFSAALDKIRGLDWSIDQVSIPHLQYALGAELAIFSSEASAYHRKTMAASADLYSSDLRRELDAGMVFLATDYISRPAHSTDNHSGIQASAPIGRSSCFDRDTDYGAPHWRGDGRHPRAKLSRCSAPFGEPSFPQT